jgi:hypothetical protein
MYYSGTYIWNQQVLTSLIQKVDMGIGRFYHGALCKHGWKSSKVQCYYLTMMIR